MPKAKKVAAAKAVAKVPAKVAGKAVAKVAKKADWQPYAVRAVGFAKKETTKGVPLKAAFKLDAEGLKTLRRRMRAAIRAATPEGKVLAAHKLGVRWLVTPEMRRAAEAVNSVTE